MANNKNKNKKGVASNGRVRGAAAGKNGKPASKRNTLPPQKSGVAEGAQNKLPIILIAATLALVLAAGVTIGIIAIVRNSRGGDAERADYLSFDSVSKYVSVPESAYKNLTVKNGVDPVDDSDVQMEILKLLANNKGKTPLHNGSYDPSAPLSVGDVASIRYLGYTLDGDGNRVPFDGGCNFDLTGDELELGSGSFISGFESGLIGKIPAQYSSLDTITLEEVEDGLRDGTIMEGDVIRLTYTLMHPNGKTEIGNTVLVDLGAVSDTDARFGDGFTAKMIGRDIGSLAGVNIPVDVEEGRIVYLDLSVSEIYRGGDNPIVVETRFPLDYGEESLNGKTAFFRVYVDYCEAYEAPEWNDVFVEETLGVDADELSEYVGESLTEKYESYIKKTLEEQYAESVRTYVENEIWTSILEGVTVIRLPEGDVTDEYNNYVSQITNSYNSYGTLYGYSSVDEYACLQLGLSEGDDWKAVIREEAEYTVAQKLAFYYVATKENYIPTGEEFETELAKQKQEVLDAYLESADCKRENYETEEEYQNMVAIYKSRLEEQYSDEYYVENTNYVCVMNKIRATVTVTD